MATTFGTFSLAIDIDGNGPTGLHPVSKPYLHRGVSHEPCPACGSRDNLARWLDDGHAYCFGCGHYEPGSRSLVDEYMPSLKEIRGKRGIPEDAVPLLSLKGNKGLMWLLGYLQIQELDNHDFLWSESRQWLITHFPEIKEWSARNFSGQGPKYIESGGLKDHCILINPINDQYPGWVVVVEDYVSAVHVAQSIHTMPLFGVNLDKEAREHLKKEGFSNVVFWLDADKQKRSYEMAWKHMPYGMARVIRSSEDPKCLHPAIIQNLLNSANIPR